MKLEAELKELINVWKVCPYSDPVEELFESLRHSTEAYVQSGELDTQAIISVVKDLRTYLNPDHNVNLFHFTDIICDAILLKFEGMVVDDLPDFIDFTRECELCVFD